MKTDDAEEYTQALSLVASGAWRQVALGIRMGVPRALGLSREEWGERLGGYVRLSVEERQAAVAELQAEGMNNSEIADSLGVDETTVRRDLTSANAEPDPSSEPDADVDSANAEDRYPELASVPPEHRETIAAELDAMPDEERPAARASLETADVVYSTNAREAILSALPLPRVPRDLHNQAAKLIPKHREAVAERIEQIERKLGKVKEEVQQ